MDIGQGAGLATASGVRPLVPPVVAGVLARADAGTDFSHTGWSWMESWVWIVALVVLLVAGWALDRGSVGSRQPVVGRPRPESNLGYGLLSAAMGALTFAASLAGGGETAWPGIVAGAVLGFVGYLAVARLFMRATQRLNAAGDPGALLGIARDVLTIGASVLVVFVGVLGYVAVLAALALLALGRGRGEEKYAGLRILR